MKKFRELVEQKNTIVFTFGRFNPPTTGHEKLIQKVKSVAGSQPFRIYPSFSQNQKKDPLPHALKIAYMRKMFPQYAKNIIADKNSRTAIDIAVKLYDEGFKNLTMVVGSDRVKEFQRLLTTYNGVGGKRHGYYKFDNINVVSAGERDPDAEGVEGMSASKMRTAASDSDFESFKKGLPSNFKDDKKLYLDVRKYMGIREQRDMGEMTDMESLRDLYLTGQIWNIDDLVEANGVEGRIIRRGTNYVAFNDRDGKVHKAWLHEITINEIQKGLRRVKQDPDIKGDPGTEPAKYYKGVAKSKKKDRDDHFEKGAKMDDDNPAAYTPAPGDKDKSGKLKKTKPSKYTLKYKKMFGDEYEINEKIAGLVKKADKSGVSYSILKQVYNRGMAAWRTGHRPGTTPQQWAFARVNSFLTGGGARKADADLWTKAKASKKRKKEDVEVAALFKPIKETQTVKLKKFSDMNEWGQIVQEAEYQGRKVKLNDPFRLPSGSTKKFGVYVKNEKGNIIKVTFGDPNMEIKRDDPNRRKNFRARHNCDNPGPKSAAWLSQYCLISWSSSSTYRTTSSMKKS